MGNDVHWHLLPHRAREFFNLPEEFDRRTLKRAYNRMIRVFKPEKAPQEFQRIRSAFEQLENELRYGADNVVMAPQESYTWIQPPVDVSPRATDASKTANAPDPTPLKALLSQESPGDVFLKLKKRVEKRPVDFFMLATLSDIVEPRKGVAFLDWLLKGLKQHPRDPGLFFLAQQFLRQPHPASVLAVFLIACSKVIRDDRFYLLTEQAWTHLLRDTEFPKFADCLRQCESNLRGHENFGQIAFYLDLLKRAAWLAPDAWISEKLQRLEPSPGQVETLGSEFEMLDLILAYRESRESSSPTPIERQIDRALESYYLEDESAGDQAVIDAQLEIARNPQALIAQFPTKERAVFSPRLLVWNLINEDVAQRHGVQLRNEQPDTGPNSALLNDLIPVLKSLEQMESFQSGDQSHLQLIVWLPYLALVPIFIVLLIVIPVFVVPMKYVEVGIIAAVVITILLGITFRLTLHDRTLGASQRTHYYSIMRGIYQREWRGRLISLMEATGAWPQEIAICMEPLVNQHHDKFPKSTWMPSLIYQDDALTMFAIAQAYRR